MRFSYSTLLRPPRLWVLMFFSLLLITGIGLHRSYGISWDEKTQRGTGAVSVKYMLELMAPDYVDAHPELDHLPKLMEYQDRDYGPAFEIFLVVAEKAAGMQEDTPQLFYLRHLLNFLFFFVACIFFFLLVKKRTASDLWGLVGVALFVLSPRIFADSFYNSKDLPFLSAFTIGLYFMFEFLETRSVRNAMLFGFTAALATDIRILGILLPLACGGLVAWEWIMQGALKADIRKELRAAITLAVAFCLFTVIMWPYLWSDPIGHFGHAWKSMSQFMRWDGKVFFMGELINGNELPFYYLPVWIAITTPLLILGAFFVGVFSTLREATKSKFKLYTSNAGRRDLSVLALMALPFLAVVVMGSTLYSGWRQLYFLYVPMTLVALTGLHFIYDQIKDRKKAIWIMGGLAGLQCAFLVFTLYRMHPYGNVYFNVFAGSNPGTKYELDYWGLAYREGLEQIVARDASPEILLKVESYPGKVNHSMLNPNDQTRVRYVDDVDSADYYLGTRPLAGQHVNTEKIYTVTAANLPILDVYKLK
jgi:Dolichyl-phosphate-mannose-protein mannosyltransferase